MKTWQQQQPLKQVVIERELPKQTIILECIFGPHKADVMHRGTAYCRTCYDERNPFGKLIN